MAVLKALALPSAAAAAIASASIATTASCSSATSSSSSCRSFPKLHFSGSQSESSPTRKSGFSHRSNLFQNMVGKATAVNGVSTVEKAPVQELDVQNQPQGQGGALPDIMTEFMVDMKCEGCVSSVRNKLEPLEGVKKVDVDLANQVVRVLGSASLKALNGAMEQTGRKARLIGQGSLNDLLISAAVAEFKGPEIHGVVRFAQVSMELARIEATFSGLSQGPHGWSINEYGDLTRGAASTGGIFNSLNNYSVESNTGPLGDLGTLLADSNGEADYSGSKPMLKVADLIGRALVVYATEDKSEPGIAAAVIARSAGVGENYKKLCTCDGTVIWEATNKDFVKV